MTPHIKKWSVAIAYVLCMLLIVSCNIYTAASDRAMMPQAGDGIIRFHITASSDQTFDRELKLKVRDEVLHAINKKLVRETMKRHDAQSDQATLTIGQSRAVIKNNLREIEKVAANVIRDNGYAYVARAELGISWIPEKRYGDVTFPAGNYEALNLTIGEGAGENWWCVLFPPLCIIDTTRRDYGEVGTDGINTAEWVTDNPDSPMNGTVRLRFKTIEIIDSIRNE